MKRIISIILAFALLASIGVLAYADSPISESGMSAQSTITYEVGSSFTVVIPATISGNDSYTFGATMMHLDPSQQVNVYCNEMADGGSITLTSERGSTAQFRFTNYKGSNCVASFRDGELTSEYSVNGQVDGKR